MFKPSVNAVARAFKSSRDSFNAASAAAPEPVRRRARRFFAGAVVLILVIVAEKKFVVWREARALAEEAAAGPRVKVGVVGRSPGDHLVTLTGETRPFAEAILYAKVSGYLKSIKVDKGDAVTEGQMLAFIESPETDQAFAAAQADQRNKTAIFERMAKLLDKRLVSQQEADQAQADAEVAEAKLRTQATLKSYETIRAPFTGMVTARFADPGALVQNATTSQTSALPVVTVSTVNHLRVAVFVDQRDAPYVAKGDAAEITSADLPDLKITGSVSRVSGELDARTKMLLTEIDVDNSKRQLVPGAFVQVALRVKSPPYLQAPVESLLTKADKQFLTVITPDNTIAVKAVEVASNDGKLVYLRGGVEAGEKVALSVGDTVPDGGKVRPIEEAKK